ncbi:uncharacterized protein LOC125556561 [Triticum urartu]|nr:uncharacterized protein LOC125556561 [Triticum urartu]
MDGGVVADGDNAREDNQGAADGSGLGAPMDPALVANGEGGVASEEGSVEGAAEGADGIASAGGGVSTAAGLGQGATVAGGSVAGVAKDSGQGTARPASASAPDQGTTRLASATWLCPDRMDPNSSYLLRIKLFGNPKKARKDIRCFYFEKVINCDLTNYKDLVGSIVKQYPPRYMEVAHVQYYDGDLKTCPEVKSDQDLMLMFEKHSETKVLHMIIAYSDPSEPYEPITEWHSDSEPDNNIEHEDDTTNKRNAKGGKRATRKIELNKNDQNGPKVPFDSPAMGTRSKTSYLASPAMSTRSKRRLGS